MGVSSPQTFYDAVGGHDTFRQIVHRFYEQVAEDPVLRPLYPEEDLGPAEDRLRMRHAPFPIGPLERDAWLRCMRVAVDEAELDPERHRQIWEYMEMAAMSMMNKAF